MTVEEEKALVETLVSMSKNIDGILKNIQGLIEISDLLGKRIEELEKRRLFL